MKTKKYKKLKDNNNLSPLLSIGGKDKKNIFSANGLLSEIENEEKNSVIVSVNTEKTGEIETTPIFSNKTEIPLMPFKDPFYKRCPLCHKKVKHSKVFQENDNFVQVFKCVNRNCIFVKKVEFSKR